MRIVVVGSGSAGGVATGILSEDPSYEVVLLEAGPYYATDDDLPEHLHNPDLAQLTGHDWGFEAAVVESPRSTPLAYPRGKVIGGSSAVNGAVAQRGNPGDYDRWAALGNPGWSFQDVLPSFRRLESDQQFPDSPYHGADGLIPITRYQRPDWAPAVRSWEEACVQRGFERVADMNEPGSSGVGPMPRNLSGDRRASSARTYIRAASARPNVTIRGDAMVARVLFDGRRAAGVELVTTDGTEQVEADIVVLSGGAINSPQILTLSGIGPDQVLARLGIHPVVTLPGVGSNLQDHPTVPIVGVAENAHERDVNGFRAMLNYRSSEAAEPDLFIFPGMIEMSSIPMDFDFLDLPDPAYAFVLLPVVGKPKSLGWLDVTSTDPAVAPQIHLNFLSDPEGSDLSRLCQVTKLAYEIMAESPVADHLGELLFIDSEIASDSTAFEEWVRQMVNTAFHCVGTCAMGPEGDDAAVVSPRLAVHGTEGLYVGDASIMPEITAGLTNMPSYMIGARVAEFVRADHPEA